MQIESTEDSFESVQKHPTMKHRFDAKWLYQWMIKPRSTLIAILEKDRSVWLIPLLILTLLVVIEALVYSQLRMTAMANNIRNLDFMKTISAEEQAFQFLLIGPPVRPLYVFVTPFLYSAGRLWIAWYLISVVMNLILTVTGAKSSQTMTKNLVAWTLLPLGLRYLIQIVSMLITQTAITTRGLSFLVPVPLEFSYLNLFLQSLLGSVDIFFLWTAALMIMAVGVGFSFLNKGKAIAIGLLIVVITLLLMALSGFLIAAWRATGPGVLYRASWYFQFAW